ncbi:MAG: 3-phosphoshikimate 1-carboxyvinyltransferase [Defluviitaleaceae bacterium]|nr:3-phosphoshikimate 1-carboxyvinyltransferase [Defluviitaleaceae bacterium]
MKVKITGGQPDAGQRLSGSHVVPGDKSISHRSVMLGAMAAGITEVDGFLTGEDCLSTIRCFRALGVDIRQEGTHVVIHNSRGGFTPPQEILDVGNSGTTLRLMTGLLAGQPFTTTITGDESIQKRPMRRVTDPLTQMGAKISGDSAPVTIEGNSLKGINYTLPVASAQVKSAILLASLYADGDTVIEEPVPTRDHTEIMLQYLGADIVRKGSAIISHGALSSGMLNARPISVPGDISSAAFLLAAAAMLPGSAMTIKGVGVNPTRTGIIHVLRRMGADIQLHNERNRCGEPVADIEVRYAPLKGTVISGAEIPTLIDEIPAIAAVALFAQGETIIKDASELRVKETDRIKVVAEEFGKFFATNPITPQEDGMTITGGFPLQGTEVDSHGDHRLAMSLSILALAAQGETTVNNSQCADISFPGFYELLPYTTTCK